MSSDFQLMFQLMQQPYFLHEILPYWIFILAAPAIFYRFMR